MTTWTGSVPTFSSGQTTTVPTDLNTMGDALQAVSEAWTSYVPVITGTTTNPVVNNGTITGSYALVNKLCFFRFRLTMGSTTTYGSGAWLVTLPAIPAAVYVANTSVGNGSAHDTSGGTAFPLAVQRFTVGDARVYFGVPAGTLVAPTVPFTWANGDTISASGSFEVV